MKMIMNVMKWALIKCFVWTKKNETNDEWICGLTVNNFYDKTKNLQNLPRKQIYIFL